jgi:hypothetical protein
VPDLSTLLDAPAVSPIERQKIVLNSSNTVGCGTLRWYQTDRQTFKLFNKYAGFWWRAGPRVGCARKARAEGAGTVAGKIFEPRPVSPASFRSCSRFPICLHRQTGAGLFR